MRASPGMCVWVASCLLVPVVVAHEGRHEYVIAEDCALFETAVDVQGARLDGPCAPVCNVTTDEDAVISVGGVCFPPSHISPLPIMGDDMARIRIDDLLVNPTPGFVCQDLDEDRVCGGRGENQYAFCSEHQLYASEGWKFGSAIYVFPFGPIAGTLGLDRTVNEAAQGISQDRPLVPTLPLPPRFNAKCAPPFEGATRGFVDHSP